MTVVRVAWAASEVYEVDTGGVRPSQVEPLWPLPPSCAPIPPTCFPLLAPAPLLREPLPVPPLLSTTSSPTPPTNEATKVPCSHEGSTDSALPAPKEMLPLKGRR